MSKRLNQIRKQVELRRREIKGKSVKRERTVPMLFQRHDEARDEPDFYLHNDNNERKSNESWINKDWFIMRLLTAATIFLVTAILFRSEVPILNNAKQFVVNSYEQEFQFTAVADWYENQFGRPLALLPSQRNVAMGDTEQELETVYAVPATGQIAENFEENGTGVLVETELDAKVEAVRPGMVIHVGEDDSIGKSVVIRHYDGGESSYGMLEKVEVRLYDHVENGTIVGTVSNNSEVEKGVYYFSLKEGEHYIDPNDVIHFE